MAVVVTLGTSTVKATITKAIKTTMQTGGGSAPVEPPTSGQRWPMPSALR